jgi:hypothetical protein
MVSYSGSVSIFHNRKNILKNEVFRFLSTSHWSESKPGILTSAEADWISVKEKSIFPFK